MIVKNWEITKRLTQVLDYDTKAHCEFQGTIGHVQMYTHDLDHLFFNYVATFSSHFLHKLQSYNLNFH
jgi:hypothetical protein